MKKYCIEGFFKALNENTELKRKFGEIRSKYRKIQLSKEESAEFLRKELIPFARNLGFNFNEIDYIEYQREKEFEPLKDEELEMVSGGAGFFSAKTLGLAAFSLAVFSAPSVSNLNPFVSNKAEVSSQAAVLNDEYRENGLVYKLETNDENGDNIATVIRSENTDDDVVVIPEAISAGGRTFTVKAIGYRAFKDSNISEITIPDSVETIRKEAFFNCGNLNFVNFGENSHLISLEDGAFLNSHIRNITIPDSVEIIGDATFSHCENLDSVNFGENSRLSLITRNAFFASNIREITIPDSVRTIGRQAFVWCRNLNSVNFGKNSQLNLIEENAFLGSGIRDITIPDSVETIEGAAFEGCRSLDSVNLGENSRLKSIGNLAFWNSSIRDITVPDSVEIGEGAFMNCRNLNSIRLRENPRWNTLKGVIFRN